MKHKRRLLAFAVTSVVTVLVTFLSSAPASAHMGISSSNPANGSQVAVAPDELTLQYSVNVDLDTAAARIRYLGGPDAPITEANRRDVKTETLTKSSGTGEGNSAVFDLPELPAGLYAIDWSVAEIGGHTNNSMLVFKVTDGAQGSAIPVPAVLALAGVAAIAVVFVVRTRRKS